MTVAAAILSGDCHSPRLAHSYSNSRHLFLSSPQHALSTDCVVVVVVAIGAGGCVSVAKMGSLFPSAV